MQIRRAEAADEGAFAWIRRSAILGLAVPAMSMEQAEHYSLSLGHCLGHTASPIAVTHAC
jgi:hypothetical protein